MPNRQVESEPDEARHSSIENNRAEAGQMQGANGLPRDTNADDVEPGAGDQDIDTAGTEADEQSVVYNALGFPRSDTAPGPPKLGLPSDGGSPAKVL